MNNALEISSLFTTEETTLQEKECIFINDSSLPAAQVLTEQIERLDGDDNRAALFIP